MRENIISCKFLSKLCTSSTNPVNFWTKILLNRLKTKNKDGRRILLLSIMKKVRARKVCRTDMSEGQKCNSNQNVIFIHLIAIERRRIPIRNGKTYFNNVIQSRLCYNKILIFLSVRHKIQCWAPFSYSIQKKMFSIPFPPFFG